MKYLPLYISEDTPLYGNVTGIHFLPDKKMNNCNTMTLSFLTYNGTHIDLPYHYKTGGITLNNYHAEYWQFDHVEMVDLSGKVGNCQIIGPELFSGLGNLATDLLMIKTGNSMEGGTDLISVSSYSKREEERKAHNIFLNPDKGEPILLNEDMKLDMDDHFNK